MLRAHREPLHRSHCGRVPEHLLPLASWQFAIGSILTKLRFCVMEKSSMLRIRPAAVTDAPLLLRFSRELAEYECQPDAVVIKEETLTRDGFGVQPKFRSLIAEWDGQAIGYALFFGIYSSCRGSGIFLEDLFVREAFRGRGIGRALLCQVARIARQEGSYGIRLEVLGWNESAIKFYKSLGGEFFDEWKQVLLEADALNRLADG
jgi:GNAT superfamily N-acetyltransferase